MWRSRSALLCGSGYRSSASAEMAGARRIRRVIADLLAATIVVSAAAGILRFVHDREFNPYSDDASIDADVVHVAPSVSGRIVRLNVTENQHVKAGDVMFEIDPEPFKLRVDLATADLKVAEALLDTQKRTVATETANATIANDQIAQARSSLRL